MGSVLRTLALAQVLALGVGGAPIAAQQAPPGGAKHHFSRIPVAAADNLAGRSLADSSGSTGGTIKYVLVAPATGEVQALIVSSAGPLDVGVEHAIVPWRAIASVPPAGGPVRLNVSFDQIRQGPKIGEEALSDLSRPELLTTVTNAYAAAGPPASQRQAQSGHHGQTAHSQPPILIGRDVITTLVGRPATPTSQMVGAEVRTPSGHDVGEIEHVMIDTAHGQVAYVILGRGGFLGMDEDWVPLPVESLNWDPARGNYVVNASEKAVNGLPALKRSELPTSVSASQLGGLYQRFAVAPYWQQTAEVPGSEPTGTAK